MTARVPAELREADPAVYAWSPDEEDVIIDGVPTSPERPALAPPLGPLLTTSGAATAIDTGDGAAPRVLARWTPAASDRVEGYEVECRVDGGLYEPCGTVDGAVRDADARVFLYLTPVEVGASYEVRARSRAPGLASAWLTGAAHVAQGPTVTLTAPTGGTATGGAGAIAVAFTAAADADFRAIEFYAGDTDDTAAATLLAGPIYGAAGLEYGVSETGLSAGVTRHYFARAVGPFDARSAFSAGVSATTDA